MKCPNHCRCGRHDAKRQGRTASGQYVTTYGEEQRQRVQRMTEERHAAGIQWRDTPSESFDWDYAIELFHRTLREVYG